MSSNALTLREENYGLEKANWVMPPDLDSALKLADIIAKSTLCPNNFKNKPGDVFVAAKFGEALGLSIMQSIIAIAVINGRPGIFGDDMLAVVQSHPAYEAHKEFWEGDGDKLIAVFQIKRRGQEVHESRFSVADAKLAGLWDTRDRIPNRDGGDMRNPAPWHNYPRRMLMMRARGFGLRDKFADALRGMRSVEELQDYPTIEGTFTPTPDSSQSSSTGTGNGTTGNGEGNGGNGTSAIDIEVAKEFASTWHGEAKQNHSAKDMRTYLKDVLGCDTSLQIKPEQHEKAMLWAKTKDAAAESKPESKAAAATEDTSPYKDAFAALGYNATQREEYLKKMSKFTDGQIRADLNRLVEEQDTKK